jgi:hypothetical protein
MYWKVPGGCAFHASGSVFCGLTLIVSSWSGWYSWTGWFAAEVPAGLALD